MKKKDFIHPVTEAVGVEGLQLLTPVSWNPDKGNGPSMGIIEAFLINRRTCLVGFEKCL